MSFTRGPRSSLRLASLTTSLGALLRAKLDNNN